MSNGTWPRATANRCLPGCSTRCGATGGTGCRARRRDGIIEVSCKLKGVRREGRHSSEVLRCRGALRMRSDLEDAVDQARAAPRDLLELPPVFHRPSEADRYGRPCGAVHEEVRRP